MLTAQNISDLERVQKSALRLILKQNYKNYTFALNSVNLLSLSERRLNICTQWAKKNINSDKMKQYFTKRSRVHTMKTRNIQQYNIQFAHTDRLKNSPVIYMQRLLNNI